MIRFGYSHTNAIEKIESVYCSGRSMSVTQILREIRRDKQRGGNWALNYF